MPLETRGLKATVTNEGDVRNEEVVIPGCWDAAGEYNSMRRFMPF